MTTVIHSDKNMWREHSTKIIVLGVIYLVSLILELLTLMPFRIDLISEWALYKGVSWSPSAVYLSSVYTDSDKAALLIFVSVATIPIKAFLFYLLLKMVSARTYSVFIPSLKANQRVTTFQYIFNLPTAKTSNSFFRKSFVSFISASLIAGFVLLQPYAWTNRPDPNTAGGIKIFIDAIFHGKPLSLWFYWSWIYITINSALIAVLFLIINDNVSYCYRLLNNKGKNNER